MLCTVLVIYLASAFFDGNAIFCVSACALRKITLRKGYTIRNVRWMLIHVVKIVILFGNRLVDDAQNIL